MRNPWARYVVSLRILLDEGMEMKHKYYVVLLLSHNLFTSVSIRPVMWSKVCWIASVMFLVAMLFMGIMGRMDNNSVGQVISMMVFILFFWIPCAAYHIYKRCRPSSSARHEVPNFVYQATEDMTSDQEDLFFEATSDILCPPGETTVIPHSPAPPYSSQSEGLDSYQTDFDSDPPPPYEEEPPPTYEESITSAFANNTGTRVR